MRAFGAWRWTFGGGLVLAVAVAQNTGFLYQDKQKNVTVTSVDGRGERTASGYRLFLRGRVVATDKDQGLEIRSSQLEADAAGTANKTTLKRGIATESVKITKTVNKPNSTQRTVIEGSRADYRDVVPYPVVDMTGPVIIRSLGATQAKTAQRQTMVATGRSGRATLDRGTKGPSLGGLRQAELTGSVKVTVDAVENQERSKLIATASRMIIDEASAEPTVTLLDNVNMNGEGGYSVFRLTNQRRVVLRLNKNREVTSWKAERNP